MMTRMIGSIHGPPSNLPFFASLILVLKTYTEEI
jgi:hypothetical protein